MSRLAHIDKLDSVRCFAALSVVIAHILQIWLWPPRTVTLYPLGVTGVWVFFVLSGFLITALLLAEPRERAFGESLKRFYIRRSLRIFPIYYLYLLVAFVLNHDGIRQLGAWPWLYLTNFEIFAADRWALTNSHLWTLSLEEQFYLVIPFVVLMLRARPRLLLGVFACICASSVAMRAGLLLGGYSATPQVDVFTFANLDYLALGGLLALAHRCYGERLARYGVPLMLGGVGAYYLTAIWLAPHAGLGNAVHLSLGRFALGVAAVGLIIYSIYSRQRRTLLHNPVTMHLGKISYGIYLYHLPLVVFYQPILALLGIDVGDSLGMRILCGLALTIGCAQLSYTLIEKPLLRRKNSFR